MGPKRRIGEPVDASAHFQQPTVARELADTDAVQR